MLFSIKQRKRVSLPYKTKSLSINNVTKLLMSAFQTSVSSTLHLSGPITLFNDISDFHYNALVSDGHQHRL